MPGLLKTAWALLDQSPPGSDPPLPKRLVYLVDVPGTAAPEAEQRLTAQFVQMLERFTGIRADRVNVTATWATSSPAEAQKQPLDVYLKDVCSDLKDSIALSACLPV